MLDAPRALAKALPEAANFPEATLTETGIPESAAVAIKLQVRLNAFWIEGKSLVPPIKSKYVEGSPAPSVTSACEIPSSDSSNNAFSGSRFEIDRPQLNIPRGIP